MFPFEGSKWEITWLLTHLKILFTTIYTAILSVIDFHTNMWNLIQSLLKWEVLFLHLTTEEKAYLAEISSKMNMKCTMSQKNICILRQINVVTHLPDLSGVFEKALLIPLDIRQYILALDLFLLFLTEALLIYNVVPISPV